MSTIENYIYVKNYIPTEVCEALIDECNKKNGKNILGITMLQVHLNLNLQKN